MPTHHCQHAARETMEGKGRKRQLIIYSSQPAQRSVNWTFTFRAFIHAHYDSAQVELQNLLGGSRQDECVLGHVCSVCAFCSREQDLEPKFTVGQDRTATSSCWRHLCFCRPTAISSIQTQPRFRWTIFYSWRCLSQCHSTNRRYIWAANTDSWCFVLFHVQNQLLDVEYTWKVTLPGICSVIWGLLNS